MPFCGLCHSRDLIEVLDLGRQPISNRFLSDAADVEALFPLTLVQCKTCGLVQIGQPIPAAELTPPYPWISYSEPEVHLDSLVDTLISLPGISCESLIWGLSIKDEAALRRLELRGFARTQRLDSADLGIAPPGTGVELIQDRIRPSCVSGLLVGRDRPQMIIVRHILEHTHHPYAFLTALRELLAPGGYLVVEVPDCEDSLRLLDYTMVWEEHISYFTPATFRTAFAATGWELVSTAVYPSRFERLLVGIFQVGRPTDARLSMSELERECLLVRTFAESLPHQQRRFAEVLSQQGKTAILGAGHLACAFVQYLQLQQHIAMVIDDNPRKQGMFMPGSRLPIRGATALLENDVWLCLLSIRPEAEERALKRHRPFIERGGRFASIFIASNRALIGASG